MGRTAVGVRKEMAPEKNVLYLAEDGILCVSKDQVIESMNPAVTALTGHSPAQILGCNVTSMFARESHSYVESLFKAGDTVEAHVNWLTENGGEFRCHLVGFWVNHDKSTERCIFLLSDISAIETKRIAAQEAQLVVDMLRTTVIPPEIQKHMSVEGSAFHVPITSIMALRLGQGVFDQLPQQEVMARLTLVFGAFEKRLGQFPGITKVRVFGASILYAAGLFSQECAYGADDLVLFAQDCMELLEDLSIKNYSEYTMQIGIHLGGPIICGLVNDGVEFDIFGGPVDVALIMQKTSPPNTMQISEQAYTKLGNGTSGHPKRLLTFKGKEYGAYLLRSLEYSSSSSL
jgi:PAS domain S-box-containing protein